MFDFFKKKKPQGEKTAIPQEVKPQGDYCVDHDCLGNGSMRSVAFNCQKRANEGDKVEFTLSLTEIGQSLEITRVVVQDADSGEDIERLTAVDGKYAFTMPACDVVVMIYLMKI